MNIGIISVTKSGDLIAQRLRSHYNADIYSKSHMDRFHLVQISKHVMNNYGAVVFISSTGIAVRAIADFIRSKDIDPAVVVIDSCGKFVISLLSGHLGGANELTEEIASIIKAVPVVTTATDNMGIMAPDIIAKKYQLLIDNLKCAKDISSILVNGGKVAFEDERNMISCPGGYVLRFHGEKGTVIVTHKNEVKAKGKILRLIRRDIVIGIGCKRNFPVDEMKNKVVSILKRMNIDIRSVKLIATAEIKKEEPAILYLKDYFKCDLKIFSLDEILKIQYRFPGSDFVEKSIGVRSVCQPCAYLAGGEHLTEKIKDSGMTICIGTLKKEEDVFWENFT